MKNKIKIGIIVGLIVITVFMFAGCAGWDNDVAKRGSVFGSTTADYVVVNYSGNKIMDVWKLHNVYVQSEGSSDGWNFLDTSGNVIMLGGDVKVIRIKDSSTYDSYKDYHYEFNGGDYYDFSKTSK